MTIYSPTYQSTSLSKVMEVSPTSAVYDINVQVGSLLIPWTSSKKILI